MIIRTLLIATGAMLLSACQPESSDDAATIAAAKAGYDAFATGDMDAWAKTQAADAKWTMPKGFPYAGVYYGPEQVIEEVFAPIGALWPDFKVEPVAFHASGNVVFVETKMTTGEDIVLVDLTITEIASFIHCDFLRHLHPSYILQLRARLGWSNHQCANRMYAEAYDRASNHRSWL